MVIRSRLQKGKVLGEPHFPDECEEGLGSGSVYGPGVQAGLVEASGLAQRRAAPTVLRL